MPEVVGTLKTPRVASAPSSPVAGQVYFNTTTSTLYVWNGTVWISEVPAYSTTPPASPVDGQIWFYPYDTTSGVVWQFRYNAGSSSAYKWEFVGGLPVWNQATDTLGLSATWVTYFPGVAIGRTGEYFIETNIEQLQSQGVGIVYHGPWIGGVGANPPVFSYSQQTVANIPMAIPPCRTILTVTGGQTVFIGAYAAAGATLVVRDITVIPRRVS